MCGVLVTNFHRRPPWTGYHSNIEVDNKWGVKEEQEESKESVKEDAALLNKSHKTANESAVCILCTCTGQTASLSLSQL